jgi:hypothetical protein
MLTAQARELGTDFESDLGTEPVKLVKFMAL